jgi:DNA-binding transcriptional ArsR family regulator
MSYTANQSKRLDATFAALADPTRRAILARLATGDTTVNDLAKPFKMSQPAISKHLKVLERAGLITHIQIAQSRPRRIVAAPLKEATDWLENYRKFWEEQFDRLDLLLDELKLETKAAANPLKDLKKTIRRKKDGKQNRSKS